ncbi:hypothetical protein LFL96_11180 [Paraburkholderia sp. D15]|uniref:hypothetical protein n=1 Tax=Paraburkholderia sp. D15 TaxID=2880218 RepID=UPI0024797F7F|nr:hypothetical protein [Paraburkholderia sp. D15]WGS48364.1 hypothetical protein LFL96_11180 [Paraburkholderia sp. D15]
MALRRIGIGLLAVVMGAGAAYGQQNEARAQAPAQQRAAPPGGATASSGAKASASTSASAAKPVCVDAEVDGQRALSYDCLSSQLQPKPAASNGASRTAAEAAANAPSNRVGTFNLSTERNRFGANWGNSVTPQRPAAPVVVPPK